MFLVSQLLDGSETNIRILSDYPTNITDYMQGTSQAAPMVTGTAALVWGINPELSAVQVKQIICQSAEKMGSGERINPVGGYKSPPVISPLLSGSKWYSNIRQSDECPLMHLKIF